MGITVWEGTVKEMVARIRLKPASEEPREDGRYVLQTRSSSGKWLDVDVTPTEQALTYAIGRVGRTPAKVVRHAAAWAAEHPHADWSVEGLLKLARGLERREFVAPDLPEFAGWADVLVWCQAKGHDCGDPTL